MKPQFNDEVLLKIARNCYYQRPELESAELGAIMNKESLSNEERNQLLFLIESSKYSRPLSIKWMKQEIFAKIGFKSTNDYGTVCRRELEAIYNFITRQPGQK